MFQIYLTFLGMVVCAFNNQHSGGRQQQISVFDICLVYVENSVSAEAT